MARFPLLPLRFAAATQLPPAGRAGHAALRRLAPCVISLAGWFGLHADGAPLAAADYPVAAHESQTEAELPTVRARRAPQGLFPLRLPTVSPAAKPLGEPRQAEGKRYFGDVQPVAFAAPIGRDEGTPGKFVSQGEDDPGPVPPTPPQPGRNPLFRDPTEGQPGGAPGFPGSPLTGGRGPDDLFVAEDDTPFMLDPADDQPLGVVGQRMYRPPVMQGMSDFYPIEDRWRLGFPQWNRYLRSRVTSPWSQSVIKGDYPLWGTADKFFQLTAFSDTFYETRSVLNAAGHIDQQVFQQTLFMTTDFFRGDNSFHPSEWLLSLTPAFRYVDTNFAGTFDDWSLQQGFLDLQLAVVSDYYDTTNLRIGRQAFGSDFRNFIFADTNDALRLFGTDEALRTFWNVLFFNMCQKDAASNLNTFDSRQQQIIIANLIRQDFIFSGLNGLLGFNYNNDTFVNQVDAYWFEAAVNGRIGQFGVSGAFIQALGNDTANPIAGHSVNINAQMAALELTRPTDWWTPRLSMLYASGDKNPRDNVGRGFDGIFDNPNFAGAGFSYLNREAVQINKSRISNGFSLYPNLRNKNFQPSNFVNPGIVVYNAGIDAVLSTRWQMTANVNYYSFVHPQSIEQLENKAIGKSIGLEGGLGLVYRPLIVENVIMTFGTSALAPGNGISALNNDNDTVYTFFSALTAVY